MLLDKSNYTDSVTQSPYFAGIITASMIWVTYAWATRLMNRTSGCIHLSEGDLTVGSQKRSRMRSLISPLLSLSVSVPTTSSVLLAWIREAAQSLQAMLNSSRYVLLINITLCDLPHVPSRLSKT